MTSNSPSLFRQIVVMFVLPVVAIVAVKLWTIRHMDRALTTIAPSAEELDDAPQYPREDGKWLDGRALFEARQNAELTPVTENGWRDIVAAFGPVALGREQYAATPWAELAANEDAKTWLETTWRPTCAALDIDPDAEPRFFRRSSLAATLVKYGATGTEPAPTPENEGDYVEYYENGVKKRGRMTLSDLDAHFARLTSNPWKEKQFPTTAAWMRENADAFELCAKAARTPKFGPYRVIPEGLKIKERRDCVDLRFILTLGTLFTARANLRVASGEISGAIDDVETILLLAAPLLLSDNRFVQERAAALALLDNALSIGVYANATRQPSKAETARWIALWRGRFDDDFDVLLQRAFTSVRDLSLIPGAEEICRFRREHGSVAKLFAEMSDRQEWKDKAAEDEKGNAALRRFFLLRPTFDDQYMLETIVADFQTLTDNILRQSSTERAFEEVLKRPGAKSRRMETGVAFELVETTAKPLTLLAQEYRRIGCLVELHAITAAMLAYQADHGALPPAYTVDAKGDPALSWRVLLLPYLGEEALYAKFALDEPWDSETNAALQNEIPRVYRCPGREDAPDATRYSTILGQDALFTYGGLARDLDAMRARTGVYTNLQALVVERANPVCWTRPDVELDAHAVRESFGKRDGVLAADREKGLCCGCASGAACSRAFKPQNPEVRVSELADLLIGGR